MTQPYPHPNPYPQANERVRGALAFKASPSRGREDLCTSLKQLTQLMSEGLDADMPTCMSPSFIKSVPIEHHHKDVEDLCTQSPRAACPAKYIGKDSGVLNRLSTSFLLSVLTRNH
eukprot:1159302-Pelagomonas_calceolata.AAC.11